jgi:Bardet-Biedl syndrome 7 protein
MKNYKILQALLELNVQNDDEFEMLSDKYKNLLKNKQNLEEKHKIESANYSRLIANLVDIYIDKNKFKGINVRGKLESLTHCLRNCESVEQLMEFYMSFENKT